MSMSMYALRGALRELETQELRSSKEHQVIITNEASLQRGLYLSIMQMRREGLDMLFYSSYIKSLVPESDFY